MTNKKETNSCPNCGQKVTVTRKISLSSARSMKCEGCKALIAVPLWPTAIFVAMFIFMFYSIQMWSVNQLVKIIYAIVTIGYILLHVLYVPLKIKKMPGEYDEDSPWHQ